MPDKRRRYAPQLAPGQKAGTIIRPNAGIEREYRRRLLRLVDEMYASITWWIGAEYKKQAEKLESYNGIAADASPAEAMRQALRKRMRQWERRFNEGASSLAEWFAQTSLAAASGAVAHSVGSAAGVAASKIATRFKMTRAMNNSLASIVYENTALIRSIPQKCMLEVEGLVMRAVRTGYDAGRLTDELEQRFGVTRRRAEFISRDQCNKATEALTRTRMEEIGVTEAIWIHTSIGREPRSNHVAFHGRRFRLSEGLYDDNKYVQKYIQPGELPNCYCTKRPVIAAYGDPAS